MLAPGINSMQFSATKHPAGSNVFHSTEPIIITHVFTTNITTK